ncbi:MAG: YrhK family protein [Actinomycetes bacterium]
MPPVVRTLLEELVQEYEWVHTALGILGNVAFLAGSALFLSDATKTAGVWLFIAGSAGMLVGSVGQALVRRVRRRAEGDAAGP